MYHPLINIIHTLLDKRKKNANDSDDHLYDTWPYEIVINDRENKRNLL